MKDGNNKFYIHPIEVTSDIKEEIKITDNIYLVPFDNALKDEIIGDLRSIKFNISDYKELIIGENTIQCAFEIDDILFSNYYFKIIHEDFEEKINLSNLLNNTLVLFKPKKDMMWQTSFGLSGCSFEVAGAPEVKLDEIEDFTRLYKKLCTNDKHLKLMASKYFYSTNKRSPLLNLCFIDLMTIIEMLYSPSKEEQLRFRVSLAVAKLFNKNKLKINDEKETETSTEKFNEIKKLYDIRSKLVHSGESKKLTNNEFLLLAEIVRKSLLLYLEDSEQFKQENLLSLICE